MKVNVQIADLRWTVVADVKRLRKVWVFSTMYEVENSEDYIIGESEDFHEAKRNFITNFKEEVLQQ